MEAALERAQNFSGVRNTDWEPFIQAFDGVEMVLVPAGCFMMGSENGEDDERPVHEVCFDDPFWLDRYEVTNGQFAQFNGQAELPSYSTEDNRPREQVTWFEARTFCESRGGRLPTEAEWEYAARGPENWEYPWGNEFDGVRVVWNTTQTMDVGSIPNGSSWVGALDLSGNVWEWVSSLYWSYPYDASDGRESNIDTTNSRVLRGSSWWDDNALNRRVGYRFKFNPVFGYRNRGFRCARSQ
jgi:formylglycine-generating enzyme required for sulfatase activity